MKTNYVDGFVLTVPKKQLAVYKKMATIGKNIWLKHGAIEYKECVIDDAKPKWVAFTFPKMAKAKASEVVVFSYITFKSRKHRDEVNANVMKDPLMKPPKKGDPMPFDMKRMAYGGFTVLVDGVAPVSKGAKNKKKR